MDDIIDSELVAPQEEKSKVYSEQSIAAGAFIGGPLAGAYLLGYNFKVFGEQRKFIVTWVISSVYLILLLISIFTLPFLEKIPNFYFTAVLTGAFYVAAQFYQAENIKTHLSEEGELHSWLRAIGVSTIFALVFGSAVVVWVFWGDSVFDFPSQAINTQVVSKEYGELNHEITYHSGNVLEDEVDDIANGLLFSNYFNNDQKSYAYLDKENRKYLIYIALIPDAYLDSEVSNYYRSVLNDVESFTDMDVKFVLVEDDIYNVKLSLD